MARTFFSKEHLCPSSPDPIQGQPETSATLEPPINRPFAARREPGIRARERAPAAKVVQPVERGGVAALEHEVLFAIDERGAAAGGSAPEQEGNGRALG